MRCNYTFKLVSCLIMVKYFVFFFFKQKTAYEMRISDWSSDVCSSDLYYERGLLWVLARQRATLLVALATFVLTALLYLLIAKGLFPTQDTGQLQARTQAADSEIGRAHV